MEQEVLAEFGRRLGLGPLTLPPDRPLTLTIDGLGRLSLELDASPPKYLLLTLAAPLAPYDQTTMRRALELCSFDHNRRFSLACGCQSDHVLLMTKVQLQGGRGEDLAEAAKMLIEHMRPLLKAGEG